MDNQDCTTGVKNHERIIALERRADDSDVTDREQWKAINDAREKFESALREISSRLPNWAAVVLTAGGTSAGLIIGVLSTLVAVKW
jgi:hypothetical protein